MWFSNISVLRRERNPKRGQILIRVTQEWLFLVYDLWMKAFFSSCNRLSINSFLTKIKEVGINVRDTKQRIHNTTRRVIDIFFTDFQAAWKQKYNHDVTAWVTDEEEGFKLLTDDIDRFTKKTD